ncbi:MAG: hypothetical protein QM802_19880 [Agriterribacter sp.]
MDRYRYILIRNGERIQLNPSGVEGLETSFTLTDELKFAHEVEITGEIILTGVDFKLFYGIETSGNRCGDNFIEIEKLCNGQYGHYITGLLNVIDGKYDLDKCNISITITAIDDYYCFDYNKKRDIDIFDVKPYTERAKAYVVQGVVEKFVKTYADNAPQNPFDPATFGGTDPRMLGWTIYRNEGWINGPNTPRGSGAQKIQVKTFYAREKLTVPCADPDPGPGWIAISNSCPGGNKVFARSVILTNYRRLWPNNYDPENDIDPAPVRNFTEMEEDSQFFAYDVMGLDDVPSAFDNGIMLADFLTFYINKYCGLPVKSDFFQINPESTFGVSYPQLPNDGRTYNNILFQKSDVKRLNARNNATKGVTTLEKMITDVLTLYNCQYRVQDGKFIIEHVSYWHRNITLDLTIDRYKENMAFSNKYDYEKDKLPQFEAFKAMEMGNLDFVGVPIEYFGRCVNFDDDTKTKTREVANITTDVEYCMKNSGGDNEKVSDLGFVLMATKIVGGNYYIIRLLPILDVYSRVNNCLSWAYLQEAYYQHLRPQKIGLMNNKFHSFFSTIPIKKQENISVPFCCTDTLSLTDFVKSKIGNGIIEKATLNHYRETLQLTLLYENTYQESFCTALTKFVLNSATSTQFLFDVGFVDCSLDYTIIIEITTPSGDIINSDPLPAKCSQPTILAFNAGDGNYKFRAKNVCADEQSDWSSYVTVDYTMPAVCNLLPAVTFINRTNETKFNFSFVYPSFANDIDIEVTNPTGNVIIKQFATWSQSGSNVLTNFDFRNPGDNRPIRIFKGVYKFRFRRRCGSFTTSLFSSYLNVTVS